MGFLSSRTKKILNWIFRLGITLFFFYLINKNISLDDIQKLSNYFKPFSIIISLVFGIIGFFLQTLRWKLLLDSFGFNVSLAQSLKYMLRGNLLAFLTPGRIGEFGRGVGLVQNRSVDSVISVVIDRFYAIAAILFFGICIVAINLIFNRFLILPQIVIPLCILISIFLVCIIFRKQLPTLLPKKLSTLRLKFLEILKFWSQIPHVVITIISFGAHLCLLIQSISLLYMFGYTHIGFNMYVAVQAYVFMLFFPIFIANIGIREYAFGMMLNQAYGPLNEQNSIAAFGVSMVILFVNIILPALIGLVGFLVEKKKIKRAI